jgi:hypothetical protein
MELMVAVMLHKTDDTPWSADQLDPIRDIRVMDVMPSGSVLGAAITLADNSISLVDFKDIDGYKNC